MSLAIVPTRCSGYTLAGSPCQNYCSINNPYCWRHYDQGYGYDPYYDDGYVAPIVPIIAPIIPLGNVYGGYNYRPAHTESEHRGGGGEIHRSIGTPRGGGARSGGGGGGGRR
jgi:hypothetical protein